MLSRRIVVAWIVGLLGGCGGSTDLVCSPECPKGTRCTESGCVSDGVGDRDMAVAGSDLAGCALTCAAPTPYCSPERVCVPCLEDTHCPVGQICKTVGQSRSCVTGCNDDARCGNGKACCNNTCVDTATDGNNCGGCGKACVTAHGSATCVGGTCMAGNCKAGWADCNKDGSDGCETNVQSDVKNCTGCGMACALKNAVNGCSGGCYIAACQFGFDDCNGKEADGCETAVLSDAKNCGACGAACALVAHAKNGCINASCQITSCDAGYSDCNRDLKDGCEIATGTDAKNCGACGNVCPQGAVCIGGTCTCPPCNYPNAKSKCAGVQCVIDSCNAGWGDCDGQAANGCERALSADVNNCGACGKVCPNGLVCSQGGCTCPMCNIPNAKTACINNVCVLDACLPGWDNCDNFAGNGCEADVSSDAKNCGACGRVCPQQTPFCTGGVCNNVLKSCLEIFNAGGRQNGMFTIDPDGAGPLPQVQVYCDMAQGGHTVYGVAHSWGEWNANFIVIRDRLNIAVGSINDWQTTCQLFGHNPYVGSWKNNGGTYSNAMYTVYRDSNDWWNNYALKVFPTATYDTFLILQDSVSTNCWAWYAEAGSLQSFGSPVGNGYAFCRNGNTAQERYHIYICL